MYSVDNDSAVKVMPAVKAVSSNQERFFTEGGNGVPPTWPGPDWFNIVQTELLNVLKAAGVVPDKADHNQLTKAMRSLFLSRKNPGADLKADGTQAVGTFLTNIGITDASLSRKGLVQLSDLSDPGDKDRDDVAVTPSALKSTEDNIAPLTVPVGGVILWGATVPPAGWLEANGQRFDAAANPKLSAVFPTGAVPDLRGRFVRGWANGSGVDPQAGRAILSLQDQQFPEHSHPIRVGWRGDGGNGKDNGPAYLRFPEPEHERINTENAGGTENRPANIALMYIVKTDGADAIAQTDVPTSIILSPAAATIRRGGQQRISALVLPSTAGNHPVTWSVSDPTLGSVDQTGVYTSKGSISGTQSVIATIDTGLHAVATVEQGYWLSAITFAPLADMQEGTSGQLVSTLTPAGADEPLEYSTDNTSVAVVTNGSVSALSAGATTITVRGKYSGISGTVALRVIPAVVVEEHLRIDGNLSEIAAAGPAAQLEAQQNLGINMPVGQVGAVGSYAFLVVSDTATRYNYAAGDVASGADLLYAGTVVQASAVDPAGSWKCMGASSNKDERTLWQRIA